MSRAPVVAAALVGLLFAGAAAYLSLLEPEAVAELSPPADVAPAPAGPPASPIVPVPAPGTPVAAAAVAAPAAPAEPAETESGDDLAALQLRLDALAKAYNERDVVGLERAMWQNHAVVRPTGETMYRADLLGQWTREWTDFRKHQLSFVVDQVRREGDKLTAVWDFALVAQVADPQGGAHEMEINASQRATYAVHGEDWVLDGPIVYVGFERTLDGDPWPLGQNGL